MFEERIEFGYRKRKKKVDNKAFSKKIDFYKSPEELPNEISTDEFKNLVGKKKARLNKHRKTVVDGIQYHSGWEAEFAKKLILRKNIGYIKDWKRQVEIEINVIEVDGDPVLIDNTMLQLKKNGIKFVHICSYRIDFVVINLDDSLEYIEVKGAQTEVFKLKFKLFRAVFETIYPERKIVLVR